MIAESTVTALYESLGSQRSVAQQDMAALTLKSLEHERAVTAKASEVQTREKTFKEHTAQLALEGECPHATATGVVWVLVNRRTHGLVVCCSTPAERAQNKLRDQLAAKADAYLSSKDALSAIQLELVAARKIHAESSTALNGEFQAERLKFEVHTLPAYMCHATSVMVKLKLSSNEFPYNRRV